MSKRTDPNYTQIAAYIPRGLCRELKVACAGGEIAQSVAIEQAIKLWLASMEEAQ